MTPDEFDENPSLASINSELDRALPQDRMVAKGLYMIITTTIMFGAFGGLIGWVLSLVTPAYYRNMFDALDSEVWQIALGLGITQGLVCGVVVGCVVLLSTAWYRSRIKAGFVEQVRQRHQD